jgi:lyso-ornithine lipid O-acyltransferase
LPENKLPHEVWLRAGLVAFVLVGSLVFVAPVQACLRRRNSPAAQATQRRFCSLMCRILGIRIESHGVRPQAGPQLIAANHVSWTDIVALASVSPMTFLAKAEVEHWPLLGSLAKVQGTVFIRRGDRRQIASVNETLAGVLREGSTLAVFPEGTSTHGVLEPKFNPSHFQAAQLARASILPVAILYADEAGQADVGWYGDMTFLPHLWGLLKKKGVVCHISFGTPIDVAGKDRKTLSEEAQEQVRVLLNESLAKQAANKARRRETARDPAYAARRSIPSK